MWKLLEIAGLVSALFGTLISAYAKPGWLTHILVVGTVLSLGLAAVSLYHNDEEARAWQTEVLAGQNRIYDKALHCREPIEGEQLDECQLCKKELAADRDSVPRCAVELTKPLEREAELRVQHWTAYGTSSMVLDPERKARSVKGIRIDERRSLLLFGGFRCLVRFNADGNPERATQCFSASEYQAERDGFSTELFCQEKEAGRIVHCQGRTPFNIVRPARLPGTLFVSLDSESIDRAAIPD